MSSNGSTPPAIRTEGDSAPPYAIEASPGFAAWLHAAGVALAVTTYQIGKLFLIGADTPQTLSVCERTFQRCLGVAPDRQGGLVLAGLHAIWRFANVIPPGQSLEGHDAVFLPRIAWFTGDVQTHDVAVAPSGRPVFINTLFSCLAAVDEDASFRRIWQPPFITALAPQDRCHLNGLATDRNGLPRYVTAAAETDTPRGWRDRREGSGVVLSVPDGKVICRGLTMPHSPRLHEGRLYLLNAGTGEFGFVDTDAGCFRPICFLPGFARGLAFAGGCALVGLSLPRADATFSDLPLEAKLQERKLEPQCAVVAVDLATGQVRHTLRLGGVVRELYDIAVLPGLRRPMLVGTQAGGPLDRLVSRGPDLPFAALAAAPAAG
ncbi:MAG: TIGR03032 family protein [Rhodovarius sp.]|nr:TIGR03032 family protein [Rhodovarius sp.]